MNLEEFIDKYEGQKIDFDKAFGSQCVDVFRQYAKDVLGIKEHTGAVNGAKDLYFEFENMPLMKKHYDLYNTPKSGDVVIFDKTASNPYGHVAIVIYATEKSLVVFEQNGFDQSKGAYITVRSKNNVLSYLRPKNR